MTRDGNYETFNFFLNNKLTNKQAIMDIHHTIRESLNLRCYQTFTMAFKMLKTLAQKDPAAKSVLYQLHDEITFGASSRMGFDQLPIENIHISETNFKRFSTNQCGEPLTSLNTP